jgi:AraC-like DNA-binding protein/NAD(P)H-dependent FMN reductase
MTVLSPTAPQPVDLLLIGGSTSRPSHTRGLVDAAAAAASRMGAAVEVWDAAGVTARGDGTGRGRPASRPADLRALAVRVHAIVIASPTHHNSYSGLIKHALDHLPRNCLAGKPVALMATCGRQPTPQAVDHLRIVVRALGGTAIPSQVIATEADFRRLPERFELASEGLGQILRGTVAELLWFAQRLRRPVNGAVAGARPAGAAATSRPAPACPGDGSLRLGRGDFPDQIMRAVEYIQESFRKGHLSLDSVAREACMSRFHFSRTFKRATGTRFIDFVTTMRLAEACMLLTETNQSITSVAFGVGYRDLSHFERTFKKEFGFSPSDYRQRVRAGLEVPPRLPSAEPLGSARERPTLAGAVG